MIMGQVKFDNACCVKIQETAVSLPFLINIFISQKIILTNPPRVIHPIFQNYKLYPVSVTTTPSQKNQMNNFFYVFKGQISNYCYKTKRD